MSNGIDLLVVLMMAIAVSMVVIPLMMRIAPRIGMVDRPSARKVHDVPMARVGGWGIVLGALVPLLIWAPMDPLMHSYIFGSVVLLVFGSADDSREMGHYVKFVGQFLAVIPVVWYADLYVERFPFISPLPLDPTFAMPFTVVAMVGMINAINHSDGLDGLAGGEALMSLVAMALLAYDAGGETTVLLSVAAIGGVLGFLRFNTHPARVFMGDSGSQFLGFTVGFVAILLTQRENPALSPALPALLLGLPIVDILAVLGQRIYHGMNWFRATRNHIHHRLLDLRFTHGETVVIIYSIQIVLIILGGLLRYESDGLIVTIYLTLCAAVFAWLLVAERRGWHARPVSLTEKDESELSVTLTHPAVRTMPLYMVSILLPAYLLATNLGVGVVPPDLSMSAMALLAVILVALVFDRRCETLVLRTAIYGTVALIAYTSFVYSVDMPEMVHRIDLLLVLVMAAAIALAMRFSLGAAFRTTPMDFLALFLVLALAVLSEQTFPGIGISVAVIKGIVLLYGCEILLTRVTGRLNALTVALCTTLAVLGLRPLM